MRGKEHMTPESPKVALILCGGMGTRLKSVLPDIPKPMAHVAGRPFLETLIDQVREWGIERIVLGTGYKSEIIEAHFGTLWKQLPIAYARESVPLGTAGAIRFALPQLRGDSFVVLNGDSYCGVDFAKLLGAHRKLRSKVTMALFKVSDVSRYGAVDLLADGRVRGFVEKRDIPREGMINAGIYIIERSVFESLPDGVNLSFEHDILPKLVGKFLGGSKMPGPFIDIGTPESLAAAENFFAQIGN